MTEREWLSRGWRIDREIGELEQAQREALALATRTTARTDGIRVDGTCGNRSERALAVYADRTAEYAALIEEKIQALVRIRMEIIRAVGQVREPLLRTLLIARYVNFKKWEQIALELHYCEKQIGRLHRKALAALREVLECPAGAVVCWEQKGDGAVSPKEKRSDERWEC